MAAPFRVRLVGSDVDAVRDAARAAGWEEVEQAEDVVLYVGSPTELPRMAATSTPRFACAGAGLQSDWFALLGAAVDDVVHIGPGLAAEVEARVRVFHARRGRLLGVLRAVAHDVRNPLTTIVLVSELLAEASVVGSMTRADADEVVESADRASALLEAVGAALRAERGELRVQRRPVDLGQVLRSVAARPFARRVSVVGAESVLVMGDPRALREAVVEMMVNGLAIGGSETTIQASVFERGRTGGVAIRVPTAPIADDPTTALSDLERVVLLRERDVPVSPVGLAHASALAGSLGGALACRQEADELVTELWLPSAVSS